MSRPADDLYSAFSRAISPLGRALRRAANEAIIDYGLSEATALPVVRILWLGDGQRQNVLAEAMALEGPSLVRLLDQLTEAGLVERREDPKDRRAKTIHLTPAGRELGERVTRVLRDLRRKLFKGVSEKDLEAGMRVIYALEKALGASVTGRTSSDEKP